MDASASTRSATPRPCHQPLATPPISNKSLVVRSDGRLRLDTQRNRAYEKSSSAESGCSTAPIPTGALRRSLASLLRAECTAATRSSISTRAKRVLPDWPNDRHLETIAIASFHPSALASDLKQTLIAELDSFLCGFTIPRAASTLRGGQRQRDGGAAAVKMALVQRLRFNAGPRS